MNQPAPKKGWMIPVGLGVMTVLVLAAYAWLRGQSAPVELPVLGTIPGFTLTNQNNEPVTAATMRGQVWVADIIFTRCPGPCAAMTRHLAEVQSALPANKPVRLVSLTSDPEYDTVPVLKRYAEHYGADANHWWFLTGDKKQIRELAVNDFKFVMVEKKPEEREVPEDLFIHSTFFVLVDAKGQVRGWKDGQGQLHAYYDSEDPSARAQMLSDIRQLLREK